MESLRTFQGYLIRGSNNGFYPPILDKNPNFAAGFLTDEDTIKSYEAIYDVFDCIKRGVHSSYFILEHDVLYNHVNFRWFVAFYLRLCKILERGATLDKEDLMKYSPNFYIKASLSLQFPFYISKNNIVEYQRYSLNNMNNFVAGYRVYYISNCYSLEDFSQGYPAWYNLLDTTIFEKYSERTNVRVRVDFHNGNLLYFIAGASDDWQQITSVPIEIDDIVKSIIFR